MDPYAGYLVQLCSANPVLVAADIVDINGKVLVCAHDLFADQQLAQISGAILARPLEDCVHISSCLTPAVLMEHLQEAIASSDCFLALNEHKSLLPLLESAAAILEHLPLIAQKLTVMAAVMAELYQRTLCVSLWVVLIAQEMRLPAQQIRDLFLAALAHDLGMLHIDAAVLQKSTPLTVGDWVYIQTHVAISQQLLSRSPLIPLAVIIAVSEHHERCDATGYPAGKVESELSLEGQVLALADTLVGIYFKRCKDHGRSWSDVIPVLEMNVAAYLYRSCELVRAIIYRSELPLGKVVSGSQVSEFAARMLQQNVSLQIWFFTLREYLTSIGFTHGDRKLHALQNVVLHISTVFKGSMLFKDDLRESLASISIAEDVDLTPVIEEASLLQQEMAYHLQRLSRMIQAYLADGGCKDANINKHLEQGLFKISAYLTNSKN